MIIHCTTKLAARLPEVSSEPLEETSPLGSWHANLYTIDRHNVLLFTHDATSYTLFLPGLLKPQFAVLDDWFRKLFTASLDCMGLQENLVRRAELALGPVSYDTAIDSTMLGGLDHMRFLLDDYSWEFADVTQLDPLWVSRMLCDFPVNVGKDGKCCMADAAMISCVEAL